VLQGRGIGRDSRSLISLMQAHHNQGRKKIMQGQLHVRLLVLKMRRKRRLKDRKGSSQRPTMTHHILKRRRMT
jgi:hypothetical protein